MIKRGIHLTLSTILLAGLLLGSYGCQIPPASPAQPPPVTPTAPTMPTSTPRPTFTPGGTTTPSPPPTFTPPEQIAAEEVTFEQLMSNPERYNGKNIILDGYVFIGWEWCSLNESFEYVVSDVKYVRSKGERVQIKECRIEDEIRNRLYQQHVGVNPPDLFGKIRIKGKFEYFKERVEHKAEITPLEVEILMWYPPEPS